MGTPHNEANKGDFAKTVLMPGDPLRSKFIAENFLTELKLVNNIRGVQGYTGLYKGTPVSVIRFIRRSPIPISKTWLFAMRERRSVVRRLLGDNKRDT